MEKVVHCNVFYCEHFQDNLCHAPELHLGFRDSCREFIISDEKLEAYLDAQSANPNRPTEYGKPTFGGKSYSLRQK